MYIPELGKKIKQLRIEKFGDGRGAQKRFAEFLGINYVTYRGYEEGNVTLDALRLVAEKTGAAFYIGHEEGAHKAAEEEAPYEPLPFYSPEEKEYTDKLLEVLRNPRTKKAIKESIDALLQVDKPEPERKKKEE